jgi:hypothetical protein
MFTEQWYRGGDDRVHASPSRLPARYRHRIDFLIIRKSEHFLIIRKLELCVERLSPTTKSNLRNIGRYIRNKESDGPPRPESWHSRSRGAFVISRRSPELHPVEGAGVFSYRPGQPLRVPPQLAAPVGPSEQVAERALQERATPGHSTALA